MIKKLSQPLFILFLLAASACLPTSDNSKATPEEKPKESLVQPLPAYVRSDWGDWADEDKDCLNTRHEILNDRSLVPTEMNTKNPCLVATGKWIDFYSGEVLTSARDIDIDHVVPVKLAHEYSKGQWTQEQKKTFYNDLENLVITSQKYNREKGANDITLWQPANRPGACKQMQVWMKIKDKYGFKVTKEELEFQDLLGDCSAFLE